MYLTEQKLKDFLKEVYSGFDFINNRIVENSGIKNRPDFRNDDLKLIIEFDGYMHFNNIKTQLNDELKESVYTKMGYKIIRIPYFVQLSTEMVKFYFDKDIRIVQVYQHGFIDDRALLPFDFNQIGLKRYKEIMQRFKIGAPNIFADIEKSLLLKTQLLKEKFDTELL